MKIRFCAVTPSHIDSASALPLIAQIPPGFRGGIVDGARELHFPLLFLLLLMLPPDSDPFMTLLPPQW